MAVLGAVAITQPPVLFLASAASEQAVIGLNMVATTTLLPNARPQDVLVERAPFAVLAYPINPQLKPPPVASAILAFLLHRSSEGEMDISLVLLGEIPAVNAIRPVATLIPEQTLSLNTHVPRAGVRPA